MHALPGEPTGDEVRAGESGDFLTLVTDRLPVDSYVHLEANINWTEAAGHVSDRQA